MSIAQIQKKQPAPGIMESLGNIGSVTLGKEASEILLGKKKPSLSARPVQYSGIQYTSEPGQQRGTWATRAVLATGLPKNCKHHNPPGLPFPAPSTELGFSRVQN